MSEGIIAGCRVRRHDVISRHCSERNRRTDTSESLVVGSQLSVVATTPDVGTSTSIASNIIISE